MLKQVVVDKVMARQLWKLGFREPTLSHYDLNGELQTADGEELIKKHEVVEPDAIPLPPCLPFRTGYAEKSTSNY